jgi:hypothetical protein
MAGYGYESKRNAGSSPAPQGRVTAAKKVPAPFTSNTLNQRLQDQKNASALTELKGQIAGARQAGSPFFGGPQIYGSGANALDEFAQVPVPLGSSGGGGSGRRGGSGGGGGSAPSAAQIQAYRELLASYNNTGLMAEYDRQDAAARALYDPAKVNARWDQAGAGVQGAVGAGNDRLAGILAELQAKAVQARTGVNDAYVGGDSRLQEIQSRFTGQNQAGVADANTMLGAFGAGQIGGGAEAAALQRLFAQGQITNNGARTVADAAQAALPGAYAGLGADVQQGMTRDSTGLIQQIAARRAAEQQANDAALNQMLGQTGLARIQAQQEQAQAEAKLRAELAQMGIAI